MRRLAILVLLIAGLVAVYPAIVQASSPPSGQIAFERHGDIWIVDADGGHARRLTISSKTEQRPAWSPDGRTIAFIRAGTGNGYNVCLNEIWLMNADGTNKRRVSFVLGPRVMPGTTHKQTRYGVDELAWAPNGRDIAVGASAYSSYPDMAGGLFALQLYLVRPDGTKQRRIGPLQPGMAVDSLTWRPNGSQLLLIPWNRGAGHLVVYDLVAKRYSEPYGNREMWNAVWSPDGTRIAASVLDDRNDSSPYPSGHGGMPAYPQHLVVIDPQMQEEVHFWAPGRSIHSPVHPAWSPDGVWLACSYPNEGERSWDTLLVSADGSESSLLMADAEYPAWRPTSPPAQVWNPTSTAASTPTSTPN